MSHKRIIKNLSGVTKQILNRDVPHNSEYDVPPHFWSELAIETEIQSFLNSGDYVLNNGTEDMPSSVAIYSVTSLGGVVRNHSDITLLPAVTENAPEVCRISGASIGFCMSQGDEIFGQTRLNNYAGGDVEVQLHICIDNSTADRWIQFDVHYITTNGFNDKAMNSVNGTLEMLEEVPTTPWRIFESVVTIPASAFANGEKYIYIGIERVEATGKTAPTNHPNILRYCKRYWEALES